MPSQVAVEWAGGVQGAQEAPQVAVAVLLTQAPLHAWKPLLHVKPQLVPSHVAVPLATVGQAVQLDPHEPVLLLARHAPEHA